MINKIIAKYALSDILENEHLNLAVADKEQKLIWFNQNFKSLFNGKRLKGRNISKLLDEISVDDSKKISAGGIINLKLNAKNQSLIIHPLKTGKSVDGFFLQIEPYLKSDNDLSITENKDFNKEILSTLQFITQEKNLYKISEEILKKIIITTASDFGLIIFTDERREDDFYLYDPQNVVGDLAEIKKEISANLSFISKWFKTNKKPLLTSESANNLGYNLTQILGAASLLINPAVIFENILATIIIGRKKGGYSNQDINEIDSYSSLLSVAISNSKTMEINEVIETRLSHAQKLETIGKLSSGMAHDFSNLLSSIFGSLNLLRKRVPKNENVDRLLDNIENCSIRAKDLTKGLLSFGKPTPKQNEMIKPNYLLNEISKVITQTFPKKISFSTEIQDNLYDLLGNGTEIYQVLLNLCVNAKESIKNSGSIKLMGQNITIDESNISRFPHLEKKNYLLLSVEDSGSGIAEENLQRIFDPYFSTKGKESRMGSDEPEQTTSGSGLGLYVSFGIIKAHEGHIYVTSTMGKGTRFDVYIPAFEPSNKEKTSSENKIIILAEDEQMLSELLGELLEANGYNVIKVVNGVEVLKVLTEEIKVDLAIIDYNMPEMNGLDCIKQIRKLEYNIPIILSSGSLNPHGDLDKERLGINEILPKPYEFEKLLATIKKLI
jgi:signal transduction histidine kinase